MKKLSAAIEMLMTGAAIISLYILSRPKTLGNIKNRYSEQTTLSSSVSFIGEAGEKIKFSYRSNMISGDLDMALYDSDGKEVLCAG